MQEATEIAEAAEVAAVAEASIPTENVRDDPNLNRTLTVRRKAAKRTFPWDLAGEELNLVSPPPQPVYIERIERLEAKLVDVNVDTDVPASRLFSTKNATPSRFKDVEDYWKEMRRELTEEEYMITRNAHRRNKRQEKKRCETSVSVKVVSAIPPRLSSQKWWVLPHTQRPKPFGSTRSESYRKKSSWPCKNRYATAGLAS
jgi:hypothetical protein